MVNQKINKVVIFAGGQGTRLSEHTAEIPKPLVPIAGEPIVLHLMRSFYRQGCKEFILALGYKSEEFKKFFRDYNFYGRSVSFSPFGMKIHDDNHEAEDWTIHLVETGPKADTGLRLHRVRDYIGDDPFFLTYGDGLSDVDLRLLEQKHAASDHLATITAVPLQERFGVLRVDDAGNVTKFAEKSDNAHELINGGFMACRNELLQEVNERSGDLAYDLLTRLADEGKLGSHHHTGFWHAMDTKKDVDDLNRIYHERPELFGRV